jgi:hypothetical protein
MLHAARGEGKQADGMGLGQFQIRGFTIIYLMQVWRVPTMGAPLRLPAPRPADWGFGVTIGIGVICGFGNSIVTITDKKVDFGSYAADHAVFKTNLLVGHLVGDEADRIWFTLIAGDDVEYSTPILDRTRELLDRHSIHPTEEIVDALDTAFGESISKQIENKVLRKRGFTTKTFTETGRQKCTPSVYFSLCERIDQVKIRLKFLLCGFDETKKPHMFEIDGENQPKCYDSIGMWAIGSGAYSAMSCMSYYVDQDDMFALLDPEEALFLALGAKFMAESSGLVGKQTLAEIITFDDFKIVPDQTIDSIRKIWKAEAALRVPNDLCNRIRQLRERDKW